MPREREGAVHTLNALAARAARHKARKTAPVEQHDRLLAVFKPAADRLEELAREGRLTPRLQKLLPHIDQLDRGQRTRLDAAGQLKQRVFAALRVVAALQAGR